MHRLPFSRAIALVSLALLAGAAQAADTVTEYAKVDASQFASSVFVKGNGSAKTTGKATGNQVYWFDEASNARGAALGTAADTVVSVQNTTIRPDNSTPAVDSLAKLTQGSADYGRSVMSMDLGAQMLNSDVAGKQVSGSSLQVVDFGNAGSNIVHFDFKIGLWDGAQLTQATALGQLSFSALAGETPVNTGNVAYLGNGTFRFTETSTSSSGTTLSISSALAGSFVRSIEVTSFGNDSGGSFSGDFVDLAATRTLSAPVTAVPEPRSAALMAAGGLLILTRLSRRKLRPQSRG